MSSNWYTLFMQDDHKLASTIFQQTFKQLIQEVVLAEIFRLKTCIKKNKFAFSRKKTLEKERWIYQKEKYIHNFCCCYLTISHQLSWWIMFFMSHQINKDDSVIRLMQNQKSVNSIMAIFSKKIILCRRVTRWGREEVYPALFQKFEKVPNFVKNCSEVVIYGLNFTFKMLFLTFLRRKNRNVSLWHLFFSGCTRLFTKVL